MSIESVMLSNHLIFCLPLLLPSIFPSIGDFSKESALFIRWPKDQSFSFNISLSNEYSALISFRIDWFDPLAFQGLLRVSSSTTIWMHRFCGAQPSSWSNSYIHTWLLEKSKLWLYGPLSAKRYIVAWVHIKSLQSCPTLCDPMDCGPPGSSVQGIVQPRILEWVAILSSRGSSWPRDQTCVSWVSCIGKRVLYH